MLEHGTLSNERKKFSTRLKRYRKFSIPSTLVVFAGLILAIIISSENLQKNILMLENIPVLVGLAPFFVGITIGIILEHFAKPYKLTVEESLFLDICSTLDDLKNYIEDEREHDRKRAEKKVHKIGEKIEALRIGNLRICKHVIGSVYDLFKEAFHRKLIGAVSQREKDDLHKAYQILIGIAQYLIKSEPKVGDLERLTKAMNEGIKITIPSKIGTQKKFYRSLREATLFRHVLVIVFSIIGGYAVGCMGYYVIGVSLEYAWYAGVTVGLGLIAAYLNYLRK